MQIRNLYSFKSFLLAAIILLLHVRLSAQTLIINEVSQGTTGVKEYVELVVVGTPSCTSAVTCVDLRGYILDDNNGTFASGSGVGIAAGCIRLSQSSVWSCVPIGTIILVYNDADVNPSVPADDLSLTDGNCKMVLPISDCTLFEKHTSQPSNTNSSFPTTGFTQCGAWSSLSMANGGDSFQVVPAGSSTPSSAVSWANNQNNTMIYFNFTMNASVMYFTNAVSNDPSIQANWTSGAVPAAETPGAPNTAANAAWINSMSNNCQPRILLSVTAASTNAGCNCAGTVTLSPTGSNRPYTYSWIGNTGTDSLLTGLCAGTYTGIVTSASGCSDTVTATVNSGSSVLIAPSKTNVTCNGLNNGTASVTVSGNTGALTYTWNPSVSFTSAASSLSPGTYTVTINEVNACTYYESFIITEPQPISLISAGYDATCFNVCNGQGVVAPSGGTTPFTYLWQQTGSTQPAASNLCAGTHCVTVTDANGCQEDTCVLINEPTDISLDTATVSSICNQANGSATITALGGNGSYTYSWSEGSQTPTAINLTPGSYCVKVTDMKGCADSVCIPVSNIPGVAITSSSSTGTTCSYTCDGQAQVNAAGGIAPYTYSWTSIPSTSQNVTNLCAGTYTVIVTDSDNCKDTVSISVTEPDTILVSPSAAPTICIGESATLSATATGGTGTFTYSWSPSGPSVSPTVTTNYSVIAYDANGCTSDTYPVTVNVNPPITVDLPTPFPVCPGGSVTLTATATGGNSNYTYTWTPGNTSGSSLTLTPTTQATYTVEVNDNCGTPFDTASAIITINTTSAVVMTVDSTEGCTPFCVQLKDETPGSLSSAWTINGKAFSGSTLEFCSDTAGVFDVQLSVIAANGCSGSTFTAGMFTAHGTPTAEFIFEPEEVTILDPRVQFQNQSVGGTSYFWNIEDSILLSFDLLHNFSDTGCYLVTLTARNEFGCEDTSEKEICIKEDFAIYIPQAFSPNGDGLNEVFNIQGFGIPESEFTLRIYNRWGELIYETKSVENGWDGKGAQEDVYVYQVSYLDMKGERKKKIGRITLVK